MGLRLTTCVALLLVASVAAAFNPLKTEDGQTHYFPGGITGQVFDLNGGVINATSPLIGAFADGVHDDTAAINLCLATACPVPFTDGATGVCYLPGGRYLISSSILIPQGTTNTLNVGCTLAGAGKGATMIISDTSGNGYSMIRSGGINRFCTVSGADTTCHGRFGRSLRGQNCYCQSNSDCQSGTCSTSSGGVERATTIRDLSLVMAKDNMVALDAFAMSESLFMNLSIGSKDGMSHTNTVDVVFSDGNGAVSGYSDTLIASTITQADICVWLRSTANAELITGNSIKQGNMAGCGSGIVIEASTDSHIIGNLVQTTKAPTCNGGLTSCVGGYNDGATCAVNADCKEGDIIVLGNGDQIAFNHLEDSSNPHIVLGCSAVAGGPCAAGVATLGPVIIGNLNAGSGAPVVRTNVSAVNSPTILDGSSGVMNQVGPNIWKLDRQAEPLPTCVNGSTGTGGSLVFDTTLATPQVCACYENSKWCVITLPGCAGGTATACGTS